MDLPHTWRELNEQAWRHIHAEEYGQAEAVIQRLIGITDSEDCQRLWQLYGLLASVLNSLGRAGDATEMLRCAASEARRTGLPDPVDVARYMLANQHLVHGDPRDALTEALPVPGGEGHAQCLLHSVAAQAHWKLGSQEEARQSARCAMDAAPTKEQRKDLSKELRDILRAG